MAEKITRKEMFALIAETCAEDEKIVAFCEGEIAKLERQAERARERRAEQKAKGNPEVEQFRQSVYDYQLTAEGPMTNKELTEVFGVKPQKMAPALKALEERGLVERREGEKKSAPATFVAIVAE